MNWECTWMASSHKAKISPIMADWSKLFEWGFTFYHVFRHISITEFHFVFFSFFAIGVQKMGVASWPWRRFTWFRIESWSIILFELCSNLVWLNAAGGCSFKITFVGPFARRNPSTRTVIKLKRIFRSIQLPTRLSNESHKQMQRLVNALSFQFEPIWNTFIERHNAQT